MAQFEALDLASCLSQSGICSQVMAFSSHFILTPLFGVLQPLRLLYGAWIHFWTIWITQETTKPYHLHR